MTIKAMTAAIFNAKYKFFERIKIQQWRVTHIVFLPSMPICELAMMVVKGSDPMFTKRFEYILH